MKFTNTTTFERYANVKKAIGYTFESVPNTAAGFECCRKIIKTRGYTYTVGCNTERHYWISFDDSVYYGKCFINFTMDGDEIDITGATIKGRHYTADKNLKKLIMLVCEIASIIKYDGIICHKSAYDLATENGMTTKELFSAINA